MIVRMATEQIRVRSSTRWALKIASAHLDCSIVELLGLVEQNNKAGRKALAAWQNAARVVAEEQEETNAP
jgi:hypothetical protein